MSKRSALSSLQCDAVIVGGGPSGTAAAIALARAGRRVAVIERSRYEAVRVGETLPPIARVPLGHLGLWERFVHEGHAPSPGIFSAWGQEELYEHPFIFNPYGNGWHLDRRRFDTMLALAAEEVGACIYRQARLHTCERTAAGEWQIEVTCRDRPLALWSAFLVDATGRACSLARRLGAKRLVCDRLVAVIGFLSPGVPQVARDDWTLVEATASGWWYSALLPDARIVVAYMTDSDMIPRSRAWTTRRWHQQLAQARHTQARVLGYRLETDVRIVAANSYCLDAIAGENWLAIGDAAAAFDPLSSQGLYHALDSGLRAARTIEAHLTGSEGGLEAHALSTRRRFAAYLQARSLYYRREDRWPDSSFWQRRRALPASINSHPAESGEGT